MDKLNGRPAPVFASNLARPMLPGGWFPLYCRQLFHRIAAWRPALTVERLVLFASLAFSAFYNHAFWHLLLG